MPTRESEASRDKQGEQGVMTTTGLMEQGEGACYRSPLGYRMGCGELSAEAVLGGMQTSPDHSTGMACSPLSLLLLISFVPPIGQTQSEARGQGAY